MRVVYDDIWHRGPLDWVVVPTNIGWKKNGENVMGRGIARQAAAQFEALPRIYGRECRVYGAGLGVLPWLFGRLALFPTKPLTDAGPAHSWEFPATLQRVVQSLLSLEDHVEAFIGGGDIRCPLVGCGNGQLDPAVVESLMRGLLNSPRFVLVKQP